MVDSSLKRMNAPFKLNRRARNSKISDMMIAARKGDIAHLTKLLENKELLKEQDSHGYTPLFYAVSGRHVRKRCLSGVEGRCGSLAAGSGRFAAPPSGPGHHGADVRDLQQQRAVHGVSLLLRVASPAGLQWVEWVQRVQWVEWVQWVQRVQWRDGSSGLQRTEWT